MKASLFAPLIAATALVAASTPAFADVVTFDDAAANANLYLAPALVSYQGLTFAHDTGVGTVFPQGEFASQSNGTNNFIYAYGEGLTITRQGGGVFDLASLDLTLSWYTTIDSTTNPPDFDLLADDITLTADTMGGLVVQTLTLNQGFQTYLVNLTGVNSLTLSGNSTGIGYWGLDNISGDNFGAAIPEPGTWALMIVGFAAAGAVLRHRRPVMAAV